MDVGIIQQNPEPPPARPASTEDADAPQAPQAPQAPTAPSSPAGSAGPGERRRDRRRKAAERRLEEIRQWLQDGYDRREVVTRTRSADGDTVDWVPVESQTGAVAEPPPYDGPGRPTSAPAGPAPLPPAFRGDAVEVGPPGTVPLLRKPLDAIRPVGTLDDYLAKGPYRRRVSPPDDPHPPATGADHKYAHAYQQVTCYGTEGIINTWKPYVQWSNEFSLGQLWLVRGSGTGLQTVEVGAQTYQDLYGDWSPHLFIFYTTNRYTQMGDSLGGYNTDVAGWTQVGTTSFPGMRLAESVSGADQYDLKLKVQLWAGNWWVRIGDEWMGYYPASLYNSAGLADQADTVDWGGEIVDDAENHPEPTSTWMGSGSLPAAGWTHAAYMRNLSYVSDTAGTLTPVSWTPDVTNAAAYDLSGDPAGTTAWGSSFWWGGPGGV